MAHWRSARWLLRGSARLAALGLAATVAFACGRKEQAPAPPAGAISGAPVGGAAGPASGEAAGAASGGVPTPVSGAWEEGPAALEKALAAHAPVLLYVSSEWCPPCRAMEANLLSKQAFWDATTGVLHVRIDGDAHGAQAVAERFEARAYPTLLLLGADGQEVFRAHHAASLEELAPALASAAAAGKGFKDALGRFAKGAGGPEDCGLFAAVDWSAASGMTLSTEERLAALKGAFEQCGAAAPAVKSQLAAHLLGLAAMADTMADSAQPGAPIVPLQEALLDTVFRSDDSAWAARAMITTWATPVVQWTLGADRGPRFAALRGKWLRAAAAIRARPGAGLDMQLLGYDAVLDFHRLENGDTPLPAPLREEIEAAVARVDGLARSAAERHAVVSNAAYLLRSVGLRERARDMLVREIARADAPSYYQTTLSQWALQEGRRDQARRFAHDAVTSARGRASRLQWMVNEVGLLSEEAASPAGLADMLSRATETYAVLFAQDDAFQGRNAARAARLAELLGPHRADPAVKALVERYAPRCAAMDAERGAQCRKHFAALRAG